MRSSRLTLLLAATLLVAAEVVSLYLLLRGLGEHQTQRTTEALDRAMRLMPRIAEWARTRESASGEALAAPWIEPFHELTLEDPQAAGIDEAARRRLEAGELVVISQVKDRRLGVLGLVQGERGKVLIRLTETEADSRLAPERSWSPDRGAGSALRSRLELEAPRGRRGRALSRPSRVSARGP